jgi:hypothetical protein
MIRHPSDAGLAEAEIAAFDGFWQCQTLDTESRAPTPATLRGDLSFPTEVGLEKRRSSYPKMPFNPRKTLRSPLRMQMIEDMKLAGWHRELGHLHR